MNPVPCSAEELAEFAALQERLRPMFSSVFADSSSPRTVLVNPSLSLDPEILANIAGVLHYERDLKLTREQAEKVSQHRCVWAIFDIHEHAPQGVLATGPVDTVSK